MKSTQMSNAFSTRNLSNHNSDTSQCFAFFLLLPKHRAAAVDLQLAEARHAAQQLQLRVEALGDAHVREADFPDKVQLLWLRHVHRARHLQGGRGLELELELAEFKVY